LKKLKAKKENKNYNNIKADIYSLGMTLLSAVGVFDTNKLYNFEKFKIRKKKLEQHLLRIESEYSKGIANILRTMLEKKPKNRINPS
jgi:serine/threonine protein kinase